MCARRSAEDVAEDARLMTFEATQEAAMQKAREQLRQEDDAKRLRACADKLRVFFKEDMARRVTRQITMDQRDALQDFVSLTEASQVRLAEEYTALQDVHATLSDEYDTLARECDETDRHIRAVELRWGARVQKLREKCMARNRSIRRLWSCIALTYLFLAAAQIFGADVVPYVLYAMYTIYVVAARATTLLMQPVVARVC